jgi:hypothetical protein
MDDLVTRASNSMRRRWEHARNNARIRRLNLAIAETAQYDPAQAPVVFFNASTRLMGISLNAAYNLITSCAVRLAGVPVVNFACERGMGRCVLGTNRDDNSQMPPCAGCIGQSRAAYVGGQVRWFQYEHDPVLAHELDTLSIAELMAFTYEDIPLGALVLPSIRWVLRRHSLKEDEDTRFLYSEYILSAYNIAHEFNHLLDDVNPQAVVVFNGMFFPEASARWVAQNRGVRVISHEVGLQPYSAFFTTGDATAYPIQIPDDFVLTADQNSRLDEYLENRMQGNFSMAGVRFWPEVQRLDEKFLAYAAQFRQMVPVFTNVIFDTSQPHSNVVFTDMFAWLEQVVELAGAHPDTLFVLRAHPDEARPGKESRESVSEWVRENKISALPNIYFVEPRQYFSSYELIQRSKFVMVYNSTIGLEASILGAAVLCGGRARFTQLPTVFFLESPEAHRCQAEEFLAAGTVEAPSHFQANARRFLYYQLYRSSLPFGEWVEEDGIWQGYVRLKDLKKEAFDPRHSPVLQTLVDGIINGKDFSMDL